MAGMKIKPATTENAPLNALWGADWDVVVGDELGEKPDAPHLATSDRLVYEILRTVIHDLSWSVDVTGVPTEG